MKVKTERELTAGGVAESTSFDLSHDDSAHIMTILRDTLYSDKVLAVLREYSSNAWDAHRMAGKPDLPIKVVLPTDLAPKLVIRDYGPGLSRDDVFDVYTKYGKSTKRDTDNAVGMLGIGSKSGFAYADSFSVTSWQGGKKSLYVAVLDKSDKGTMNLMHEESCSEDETGIEIQVAVERKDVGEFHNRASSLFQHFVPRPDINMELPVLPSKKYELKSGFIYVNNHIEYNDQGWKAVMGCVPYKVSLNKVRDVTPGIGENVHGLSGVLYFDIGEAQVNASREELKYSDNTKQAIVNKVNNLVDEFVAHVLKEIDVKGSTPWSRRVGASVLRALNLPVLDKVLLQSSIYLPRKDKAPKTFHLCAHNSTKRIESLSVNEDTRILLHDCSRALAGYSLTSRDVVVRRKDSSIPLEEVEKELKAVIKDLGIQGVPVKKMSSLQWDKGYVASERSTYHNHKHTKNMFCLKEKVVSTRPWSRGWDVVSHEPAETDVFVVLTRFIAYDSFFSHIYEDKQVCEFFKLDFPKIYGYKSTDSKPVDKKDCTGVSYKTWREKMYERLLADPENRKLVEKYHWQQACRRCRRYDYGGGYEGCEKLQLELGADHDITKWVRRLDEAEAAWNKLPPTTIKAIQTLAEASDYGASEAGIMKERLEAHYPLLFLGYSDSISYLWGEDAPHWIEYVRTFDKMRNINLTNEKNHEERSLYLDQRIDQPCMGGGDAYRAEECRELPTAP